MLGHLLGARCLPTVFNPAPHVARRPGRRGGAVTFRAVASEPGCSLSSHIVSKINFPLDLLVAQLGVKEISIHEVPVGLEPTYTRLKVGATSSCGTEPLTCLDSNQDHPT